MTLPLLQKTLTTLTCCLLVCSAAYADTDMAGGTGLDRWSGFYGGLSLGSSGGGAAIQNYNGTKDFEVIDNSSLTFGGHLGYNFAPFGQSAHGGLVWGIEMDISTLNLDSSKTDAVLGTASLDSSFAFSTRLRAGYAWNDSLYLYGTIGLGLSDLDFEGTTKKDDTTLYLGPVYGLGLEYALSENWSARVEAMVYDFGTFNYTANNKTYEVDHGFGTIKFGISTKF